MTFLRSLASAAVLALPLPLFAQTVLPGDHSVDGQLCAGDDCTGAESFNIEALRLNHPTPHILFNDTTPINNQPNRDWRITIGGAGFGGREFFAIEDQETGHEPFYIEGDANPNALYIDDEGHLGLNTSLPLHDIHMRSSDGPTIRMEQDASGGRTPQTWDIFVDATNFALRDFTSSLKEPFRVVSFADTGSLVIGANGKVGINMDGDRMPEATLTVRGTRGDAQIKATETNATTSARTMLELINNGRPEIIMANTANNDEWSFGAGTNFILKQGNVGSTTQAKTKVFEVSPAGDVIITGSIITGGTTCGGGCDRVFTEEQVIPATDYHAAMWTQGYLPHVGPTPEGQPFNMTDKLGGMLNALEHAHVFIDQQAAQADTQSRLIADLQAEVATLRAQMARVLAAQK